MNYYLSIGGLDIRVLIPFPVIIEEAFHPFLRTSCSVDPDILITFCDHYHLAPEIAVPKAGEEILLRYYYQDDLLICESIGGPRGPVALAVSKDFYRWTCYLNTEVHQIPKSLGNLMRMIPMHLILQKYHSLFFHASQIEVQGRGILFSAPSGTGKTTQAKLWQKYRGAKIICNDRTLVRNGSTYGYPADGSEPVFSNEVHPLGAIVLLKQSKDNRAFRLSPSVAMSKLLQQMVFPSWDSEAVFWASNQLIELIQIYPVIQLECTPDEDAVTCLEAFLRIEEVIT